MANFKRGKCRYQLYRTHRGSFASRLSRNGLRPVRPKDGLRSWEDEQYYQAKCQLNWLNQWPRRHDYIHHTRPHRTKTKRLEREVLNGADPDGVVWPLAKKPHHYYW